MRNYLHKLVALVLFFAGVQSANAYSVTDLESEGWKKVTSIVDVEENFYVFVDAGASTFAVTHVANSDKPQYRDMASPLSAPGEVWVLESKATGYAIKSNYDGFYFNCGPGGWDGSMDAVNREADYAFILSGEKFDIKSLKTNQLVGPWNNDGAAKKDENIAGNKAPEDAPGFFVYSIARKDYVKQRLNAAATLPADVTSYINNADFNVGSVNGWTLDFGGGNNNKIGDAWEFWNGTAANLSFNLRQTLTALPGGKYTASVEMANSLDNQAAGTSGGRAHLYVIVDNGTQQEFLSAPVEPKSEGATARDKYTVTFNVPTYTIGAKVTVGIKTVGTMDARWFTFDNFKLQYEDVYLGEKAIELPAEGNLVAEQWYEYDVVEDGEYALSATEGVVYVQGDVLYSEVEPSAASATLMLTAGKLFVKSASAQALTITPKNFAYTIGAGTSDIEGTYLQSLSLVTVTFAGAATNDPDAVLALLDEDAVATLKKGGEEVATAELSLQGNVLKATFADCQLAASASYSIDIPAGVMGYEEKAENEAVSVNFYTPAVFDGLFYLYNVGSGTYLSRGKAYGTQAAMDNFGLALNVVTDKEGKTTFKYFDNRQYLGDDNPCYADTDGGRMRSYVATAVEGGYKLQNTNNQKYLAVADGAAVGNAEDGAANTVWKFETSAQHVANYTAQVDAQAAAVAVAAGLEGITTAVALEEALAQYGTANVAIAGASGEKYQVYADHGGAGTPASYHKETINDLAPGIYKLTVEAFQRATWNDVVAAADGARGAVYVYAGNAKTQVKSVMEYGADVAYDDDFSYNGKHYPNNIPSAQKALATGNYTNVVYVYVADEGEGKGSLTIGMENPNWANNIGTWVYYADYKLTRYVGGKATAAEIEAFETALAAAEAYPFGFAKDEYAPYTNVEAVKVIAAAKALDVNAAAGEEVKKATADLVALETYEWTVNAEEMNAIYDGSFEYAYSTNGNVQPIAWHGINNHDNATDIRYMWDANQNAGLKATSTGKALFTKFNAFYGTEAGYTMPLKENAVYELTFIYGGWSDCQKDGYVTITGPNDEVIELSADRLPLDAVDGHQNTASWKTYTATFTTGAAGNYVLGLRKDRETEGKQSQYVYGDFKLYSAAPAVVEVASVTLDKTEATLTEAGATVTLVATVAPENATDKTVTWSTSDDKVATVVDGVVTAVANGKATITAKAGEKTATCEVTVAIPEVDPNDYTSYIKNAAVTSLNEWTVEGDGISHGDGLVKLKSNFDFNQTITLPAGKYKMTVKAAYRYAGGSVNEAEKAEYDAIQAGVNTHLAKVYAQTATYKYEGDVQNRWEGRSETDLYGDLAKVSVIEHEGVTYYVPNSSAAVMAWFNADKYVNELVFNVQEEGEVKIGMNKTETAPNGEYTNISAWTLTRLGDAEADPKVEPEYLTVVGAKVGDVAIVEGKATVESISTIDVIFDRPVALAENAGWATLADSYGPTNLVAEVLEAEEGSSEYVVRFTVSQEFNGEFTAAGEYELNIPEGFIVGAENVNCINAAIEAVITVEGGSVEPATPLAVVNVTVGEDVMSDLSAIVAAPETMIKVNFDGKFYFQGEPSIVDAEGEDASSSFEYMNGLDVDGSNSYIFMGKKEGTYSITLAKAQFNESEMMGWKAPAEDIVLKVTISVPDGIQNINADADAVIYDIHGRRVEKMTKGLYIVNGKKVLVK